MDREISSLVLFLVLLGLGIFFIIDAFVKAW